MSPTVDIIRGRGVLHCNCNNVIYLITCKNCLQQYVGSATNFKNRFRIHKSDIKTNKDRCGTTKHLNGMCKNDNIFQYIYTSNFTKNIIARPPHSQSGGSHGQETFIAPSADKQTQTIWQRLLKPTSITTLPITIRHWNWAVARWIVN